MAGPAPTRRGAKASAKGRRFAIVAARFHEAITARLVEGARDVLRRHGADERDVSVVWVPGAFELPQVAARLAERGRVDALVCLGCVIRGETPHFEYVAGEAARGIAEVGRSSGIPATFGVITAETAEQAAARAGGAVGNRGAEAALAALEMVTLLARLNGEGRRGRSGHRPAGVPRKSLAPPRR